MQPISEPEAITERKRKHILLIPALFACIDNSIGEIVFLIFKTLLWKSNLLKPHCFVYRKISLQNSTFASHIPRLLSK